MFTYEFEGEYHKIYRDYNEFRINEPFAEFYRYYWHIHALKIGVWTMTSDGYVTKLLRMVQGKQGVKLTYPFATVSVKSMWANNKRGTRYKYNPRLVYNKLLEQVVAPEGKRSIRNITEDEMSMIKFYTKINGDVFEAIKLAVKRELKPNQILLILEEIKKTSPEAFKKMKEFLDKVDAAVQRKSKKETDEVIADTMADLLLNTKANDAVKKDNILFYLKFKHLSKDQLLGVEGSSRKSGRGTPYEEVTPPLLS